MKKFTNEYKVVSTGELTVSQIQKARKEGRMFVDEYSHLGWVALRLCDQTPREVVSGIKHL